MFNTFGFLDLGAPELIIILVIILVLFGGKKLPEVSKGLAESMRELRKGISGDDPEKTSVSSKTEEKPYEGQDVSEE